MAKILIIEDSATDAHVYRTWLERAEYQVIAATHGEQGIRMAVSEQPDVILMDVVMPGVNGFQATRQLQKLASTALIPIIIITTKDQETDRIWGLRQGARDYLTKPIAKSALLTAVNACLTEAET